MQSLNLFFDVVMENADKICDDKRFGSKKKKILRNFYEQPKINFEFTVFGFQVTEAHTAI